MSQENILDTQQVLKRLGISRKTLYSLMKRGLIKPLDRPTYLRKPYKLFFREEDVERLLKGKADDPPGQAA